MLHPSDIHFSASKTWDSDPVLRALTDFVGKRVESEGPPDLVAITGDLAFSGKPEEYKLARTWLDQLWPKLGRPPKDHLLRVPGNHDVDRKKVDLTAEAVQMLLLNGRDQQRIATVLGDKKQRTVCSSAMMPTRGSQGTGSAQRSRCPGGGGWSMSGV